MKTKRQEVTYSDDLTTSLADGTVLGASVWRPAKSGKYPVILFRTPYNRQHGEDFIYAQASWYASHGFAVVVQDVRGRWGSSGDFDPFFHEGDDGFAAVEWAASLPFSNGAVAMSGMSYPGFAQFQAAGKRPPALRAIAPMLATPNPYEGWTYNGGAFSLAFNVSWATFLGMDRARRAGDATAEMELARRFADGRLPYDHLPLATFPGLAEHAPFFFDWLRHPGYDDYWAARDATPALDDADVASFCIAGLYDVFLEGSIEGHRRLRRSPGGAKGSVLRLMPWWHFPPGRYVGACDFGPAATRDWLDVELLAFFSQHLRDDDPLQRPEILSFVTGANRLEAFTEWPPPSTDVVLYVHADRGANSLNGDGRLSHEEPAPDAWPDRFTYDPAAPVPSLGGRSCCFPHVAPLGPADQRPVELLNGVLVYTSEELRDDLFVAGMARFVLHAASSAPATDWTVKICDVHPDGTALNIQETIRRVSTLPDGRREVEAGEAGRFELEVGTLCHVFKKAHRIRVEISSSNFPHWDRNLNTGNPLGSDLLADRIVATQTVFHDAARPTHLVLPVVEQ